MLTGRVAQAQSRCPTPTPSALGAVNHMLGRDSMALRTFGIMARTVAGLEVMRDSLDGARCAELDRIAFPKSATKYYYRAGSFYTIATDAQPLVDPVTGVMRVREGEHVLVFDAADNLLWPRWRGSGCLVPTEAARIVVEYALDSPTRRARLDTLGITTTHVDELPPLRDTVDSALCRRMDSTFARHPVYYFWAGLHILAANPADPFSSATRSEWLQMVFVFDSTGRAVTRPTRDPR
jgi:hypothetical protein